MLKIKLVLLICLLIKYNSAFSVGVESARIRNGVPADLYEFPFQVAILTPNLKLICGGSIVSEEWVLTAAHCVDNLTDRHFIAAGTNSLENLKEMQTVQLKRIKTDYTVKHIKYMDDLRIGVPNDIALVKVDTPFEFNKFVQPVKLERKFVDSGVAIATGFGRYEVNGKLKLPNKLLKIEGVDILPEEECHAFIPSSILRTKPSQMCFAYYSKNRLCFGDSGGPIFIKNADGKLSQIGITSFGPDKCQATLPSILTRISYYYDWIQSFIRKFPSNEFECIENFIEEKFWHKQPKLEYAL